MTEGPVVERSDLAPLEEPARLPVEPEMWPKFETRRVVDASGDDYDLAREELREYAAGKPWVWPDRTVFFICDVHADTDAFFRSLEASGGIHKTGAGDHEFELTDEGRRAVFVIGGDCFDKGPSNLRLLRALKSLIDKGAEVDLLAGNHDVRALLGFAYLGRREVKLAHLLVRMGKKSAPLFREIHDEYLRGSDAERTDLTSEQVRELLFPPEGWYDEFPPVAAPMLSEQKIQHELRRIREKTVEIEEECARLGLDLPMLHAACLKARELFHERGGEFFWFFDSMRLARRFGSFLFVHAGVDDTVAALLQSEGIDGLNREFRRLMTENLFDLYHGPLGNAFRTKYRDTDLALTPTGVAQMHKSGIYAIVHGHRNVLRGPHMLMRNGILNIECDSTLDRNTRRKEGLRGPGGAVTMFRPDGTLCAISTDYPYVKTLDATTVIGLTAIL